MASQDLEIILKFILIYLEVLNSNDILSYFMQMFIWGYH